MSQLKCVFGVAQSENTKDVSAKSSFCVVRICKSEGCPNQNACFRVPQPKYRGCPSQNTISGRLLVVLVWKNGECFSPNPWFWRLASKTKDVSAKIEFLVLLQGRKVHFYCQQLEPRQGISRCFSSFPATAAVQSVHAAVVKKSSPGPPKPTPLEKRLFNQIHF